MRRVERLAEPDLGTEVVGLLLRAAGPGVDAATLTRPYEVGTARLLAAFDQDGPCAVVGYVLEPEGAVRLCALATAPWAERTGVARRLVARVAAAEGATQLVAETDDDAVGFYIACGFSATPLGELYPGVRRYRVERSGP